MDELIAELKQQQADEVAKRDNCPKEIQENDTAIMKKMAQTHGWRSSRIGIGFSLIWRTTSKCAASLRAWIHRASPERTQRLWISGAEAPSAPACAEGQRAPALRPVLDPLRGRVLRGLGP